MPSRLASEPKARQVILEQRGDDSKEKANPTFPTADIQCQLPQKCEDSGMYTIPILIGTSNVDKAMLDLVAAINVMPLSNL